MVSTKMQEFLDVCKNKIYNPNEDSMVLGIFYGAVGCGKSWKVQQMGKIIDPTLDITRVCFDQEEFIKAVIENKKKVIIADEGIALFHNRGVMTKQGRIMAQIMDQIRQQNQCVFICVPKLVTLDKTILESANFFAYVWESKRNFRGVPTRVKGNIRIYPDIPKKSPNSYKNRLWKFETSKMKYKKVTFKAPTPFLQEPGGFVGKNYTPKPYPVGEEVYRKKKESILKNYIGKQVHPLKVAYDKIKKAHPDMTDQGIADLFGCSRPYIGEIKV